MEFTGDDVTERIGGSHHIGGSDLGDRHKTPCDPRLNRSQSPDQASVSPTCTGATSSPGTANERPQSAVCNWGRSGKLRPGPMSSMCFQKCPRGS